MKKGLLIVLLVLVVLTSACSKMGQGMSPVSPGEGVSAKEVATLPSQVASTTKATPTTVAKATGKATAQPTSVQKSIGGQYIEANKPAKSYPYIVDKVEIVDGKITKVYLKPTPPTGKTVSDEDIRWSDRLAVNLYNVSLLKTTVSKDPAWREIHNAAIWVARGGLWVTTKDPKVDINAYVGQVPVPADVRTVESWVSLVYYVNFNRDSAQLVNILAQLGMKVSDIAAPEKKYTDPEDLKSVVPGIYDLAKARGWGG